MPALPGRMRQGFCLLDKTIGRQFFLELDLTQIVLEFYTRTRYNPLQFRIPERSGLFVIIIFVTIYQIIASNRIEGLNPLTDCCLSLMRITI